MAKLMEDRQSTLMISAVLLAIGAVLGLAHFIITIIMSRYVVDPLACGVVGATDQCVSSLAIADGITAILVTVAGLFLGIRYGIVRPIMVAIASGMLLVGLMTWTEGLFWLESLGWAALLYALSYLLFGWINRYAILGYVIVVIIVILAAGRIALTF
jgi:hypothetical protein